MDLDGFASEFLKYRPRLPHLALNDYRLLFDFFSVAFFFHKYCINHCDFCLSAFCTVFYGNIKDRCIEWLREKLKK